MQGFKHIQVGNEDSADERLIGKNMGRRLVGVDRPNDFLLFLLILSALMIGGQLMVENQCNISCYLQVSVVCIEGNGLNNRLKHEVLDPFQLLLSLNY
jgi:hypothetical protein